nr:exportin-5-like [Lytechinus pictus]
MTENERNTILGLLGNSTEIPANKPVVEKVQIFLTVIYETTCHLFSDCFQSLGYEFFTADGLSSQLLESIFTNLNHLPDYRLRHIIRVVTKSFVQACPKECWQSVLVPVMTGLTSYMVPRLNHQWAIILQRAESSEATEEQSDEQETQEVVDDYLIRTVTKEFMELLGNLCWNNRTASGKKEEGGGELDMETEEAMEQCDSGGGNSGRSEPTTISELGKIILQNERLCESIVTCIYAAMSWPDSGVCMKACRLSWLIVQELATRPLIPEAVTHLYTSILKGLQVHGEHDTCRAELIYRAMNHYELLREKYPILTEVMLSLPHCTQPALQKFHEKVPASKPSERKKREAFKSFIQDFIGEPMSQKFKRKEVIRDLPAILKPMKPKINVMDSSVGPEDAGLVMLFASEADI